MRYVGINQGTGEYRDPIPFLEGTPPGMPTTPTGMVSKLRIGALAHWRSIRACTRAAEADSRPFSIH